jgi:co-chaperonin GroES (HSP10)
MVNDSGLIPTEFCVVVAMDASPEKIGSILMPAVVEDREKLAADEGTLVAVSPLAFTYENWPEGSRKPQVGDRVVFRKFAGLLRTNKDNGKDFRLLNDKDIVAIIDTEPDTLYLKRGASTVEGNLKSERMAQAGEEY